VSIGLFGLVLGTVLTHGTARAGSAGVVLHAGDLPAALERVAADTGADPAALDGRRPTALVSGQMPRITGAKHLRQCTGRPVSHAMLRRDLDLATEMWLAMDVAAADAALATVLDRIVCLSEPLEPSMAARAALLRGVLRHALKDDPGASTAFAQALRYQPDLQWDGDIPPDAKSLFESARETAPDRGAASLHLVPGAPGLTEVRVDGHSVVPIDGRVALSAGPHLLQLLRPTILTVELEATGEVVVVWPTLVQDAWAGEVDEATRQADLLGLARSSALDPSAIIFAPGAQRTWRLDPGTTVWTPQTRPLGDRLARPLLLGGSVAVLAGGALMVRASLRASDIVSGVEDDQSGASPSLDSTTYRTEIDALASERRWYGSGAGLAALGAALSGTGLALELSGAHPWRLGPMALPGGAGVGLHHGAHP
jgi:hypothetical protein